MARNIGDLSDMLFRELDRLDSASGEDLELEVGRARAIQGIACQVTDTLKLSLEASRLRAELTGSTVGVDRRLSLVSGSD